MLLLLPNKAQHRPRQLLLPEAALFMRTSKEGIVWCYDWQGLFEFEVALGKWIHDYNEDFPHQSLNNRTPRQFYEQFQPQIKESILT